MNTAQAMNDGTFNEMHQLMIHYYPQLRRDLQTAPTNNVYLLFGVSKAGKSSFLARLRSPMSTTEFMKALPAMNKMANIANVDIGSGVNSTTIVPKHYHVRGFDIYDMPGLNDTEPARKAAISILFKCLFSKVTNIKLIIVVNLNLLTDTGFLIANYHNELSDLFGNNYNQYLQSTFFVLTRNDQLKWDADMIEIKMLRLLQGTARLINPHVNLFVSRMMECFMAVNYEVQSVDDIVTNMNEITNRITAGINAKNLNDNQFNAEGLRINAACEERVKLLSDSYQTNILASMKDYITKITDSAEDLRKKSKAAVEELTKMKTELQNCRDNRGRLQQLIRDNTERKERAVLELRDAEETKISYLSQERAYNEQLQNVTIMRRISLLAMEQDRNIPGVAINFKVKFKMRLPIDATSFPVVVIVQDDEAFNNAHPFNSKDETSIFSKMTEDYVLHNSLQHIKRIGDVITGKDSSFIVSAKHDRPFTVHVYYLCSLSRTDENSIFANFFTELKTKNDRKIHEQKALIEQCSKILQNSSQDLEIVLRTIPDFMQKIELAERQIKVKVEEVDSFFASVVNKFEANSSTIESTYKSSQIFQQLVDIGKILQENDIGTTILGGFDQLKNEIDENDIKFRQSQSKFAESHRDIIKILMSSGAIPFN